MLELRLGVASDAEAIAQLHARSWRENYRGSYSDAFLDGDLIAERRGVWRERLARPSAHQLVQLAVDGSTLLGFVCAYGAQHAEWGSLIDNLHVAAPFKGRGVGRTLLAHAGAWLAARYAEHAVHLFVLEGNVSARRFYERLGAANHGVSTMETQGGVVQSCRYAWSSPALLATPRPAEPDA